jgi:hypothetical protein
MLRLHLVKISMSLIQTARPPPPENQQLPGGRPAVWVPLV